MQYWSVLSVLSVIAVLRNIWRFASTGNEVGVAVVAATCAGSRLGFFSAITVAAYSSLFKRRQAALMINEQRSKIKNSESAVGRRLRIQNQAVPLTCHRGERGEIRVFTGQRTLITDQFLCSIGRYLSVGSVLISITQYYSIESVTGWDHPSAHGVDSGHRDHRGFFHPQIAQISQINAGKVTGCRLWVTGFSGNPRRERGDVFPSLLREAGSGFSYARGGVQ